MDVCVVSVILFFFDGRNRTNDSFIYGHMNDKNVLMSNIDKYTMSTVTGRLLFLVNWFMSHDDVKLSIAVKTSEKKRQTEFQARKLFIKKSSFNFTVIFLITSAAASLKISSSNAAEKNTYSFVNIKIQSTFIGCAILPNRFFFSDIYI